MGWTVAQGAMSVCQIMDDQQSALLQIVAGILHLGNITFSEDAQNFAFIENANGTATGGGGGAGDAPGP
jgi:myosin heavy subunit